MRSNSNTNQPLVSVIIPVYNSQDFIAETIESVIGQSYKNWEMIIVDDGSSDNTKSIIELYASKDSRIKLFFLGYNSGRPAVTRNFGIKSSQGKYIDVDYLVIMGPCLSKNIARLYSDTFHVLLKSKKTKLILLSVSGYTYNEDEIKICRNFLKKYPPFMLFTRDEAVYHHYHDLAEISYNDICTAWFVNDYFKAMPVTMPLYITMAFDSLIEPQVTISGSLNGYVQDSQLKIRFSVILSNKGLIGKVTRKIQPYLLLLISRNCSESIGDYQIIRPTHKISYRYAFELFAKKNVYVSEVPDGYLNLYKNTSLNLTDRVHSTVASLAFGKPTRLFTKSKRTNLFTRVGANAVTGRITYLNESKITEEKEKLIEKLKDSILK